MSDQLREAAEAVVQDATNSRGTASCMEVDRKLIADLRQALAATARQAEVDAAVLDLCDQYAQAVKEAEERRGQPVSLEDSITSQERDAALFREWMEAVNTRRAHMKGEE